MKARAFKLDTPDKPSGMLRKRGGQGLVCCEACDQPYVEVPRLRAVVSAPTAQWRYVDWEVRWYECRGTRPECVPLLDSQRLD